MRLQRFSGLSSLKFAHPIVNCFVTAFLSLLLCIPPPLLPFAAVSSPPPPADRFALAAGLTSAVSSSSVIALAVTSELVAGAISMGLGGYLSGRVEADTHEAERLREVWEVQHKPWEERDEVVELLGRFGLNRAQCEPVLEHFREHPDLWGTGMRGAGENRESAKPAGSRVEGRACWFSWTKVLPVVFLAGLTRLVLFLSRVWVTPSLVVASRMSSLIAHLLVACVFLCFSSGLHDAI